MTMNRDILCAWLRDAHAMERATIDNLQRQLRRIEAYPQLHDRLHEHLNQSHAQVRRIEQCLHRLGTDPSLIKDAATRLTGIAETWLTGPAPDEVVKNCMATYAFEHFEIAAYTALAAAAEACGEPEIQRLCEESLEEERVMAEWVRQTLPMITQQHLQGEAMNGTTGRMRQIGRIVRENPVPTALAAAGLGLLVAAGSRRNSGRSRRVEY